MIEHVPEPTCRCPTCDALRRRSMPTLVWEHQHRPHLAAYGVTIFSREPFNHPSGTWEWVVCPCGAKHLTGGGG